MPCPHGSRLARRCLGCRARYSRTWRATNRDAIRTRRQELRDVRPQAEKDEANARAFVAVYVSRGKLVPESCAECGAADVVPYHPDPLKRWEFVWLCRDDRDRRRVSVLSTVRQAQYRNERDAALAMIPTLPPEVQAALHRTAAGGRLRPAPGSPLYNQYLTAAFAAYQRAIGQRS